MIKGSEWGDDGDDAPGGATCSVELVFSSLTSVYKFWIDDAIPRVF
jgi:hypothetical protein